MAPQTKDDAAAASSRTAASTSERDAATPGPPQPHGFRKLSLDPCYHAYKQSLECESVCCEGRGR